MKLKNLLLIFSFLILNSCIVKSLQPFYINESIEYQNELIGEWTDQNQGTWNVISFKEVFEKDNPDKSKVSKEDLEAYNKYKKGYFVEYVKKENEVLFIAMPFKIEENVFIDFIPFHYEDENINSLAAQHLLKTHSVAKLEISDKTNIHLKWLDEDKLGALYNNNQIQLKHEIIGLDESFVLTASSEELYRFLKKYNNSDIENKWNTRDEVKLNLVNETPNIKF